MSKNLPDKNIIGVVCSKESVRTSKKGRVYLKLYVRDSGANMFCFSFYDNLAYWAEKLEIGEKITATGQLDQNLLHVKVVDKVGGVQDPRSEVEKYLGKGGMTAAKKRWREYHEGHGLVIVTIDGQQRAINKNYAIFRDGTNQARIEYLMDKLGAREVEIRIKDFLKNTPFSSSKAFGTIGKGPVPQTQYHNFINEMILEADLLEL